LKEAQSTREKDHLDHVEWINEECALREKKASERAIQLEEELAKLKIDYNNKMKESLEKAI